MLEKTLIANRGECAVRIIRTCEEMKIPFVVVYSDADKEALHVRLAKELGGEAAYIGASLSEKSYLNIGNIIAAAKQTGADAIHPGWGFASESPKFSQACRDNEITFIGPSPKAMESIGSKPNAYDIMREFVGILRYLSVNGSTSEQIKREIRKARMRYPMVSKPEHAGGGIGIEIVEKPEDLEEMLYKSMKRGENTFGSSKVFVQEYIPNARHIEAQILADGYGNVVTLYLRECSLQRRFQKVVEETAYGLDSKVEKEILAAAVAGAKKIGYVGAGTFEFLVLGKKVYFLEINKRLQVEHPITEMTTWVYGKPLDLVEWQIRTAAGERLFPQEAITQRGHSIECRIYAEDPRNKFMPSPGRITAIILPFSELPARVDYGYEVGDVVPTHYDPLIAKVIVWGETREEAIRNMKIAIGELDVTGINTNIPYLRRITKSEAFILGKTNISTLNKNHVNLTGYQPSRDGINESLAPELSPWAFMVRSSR